MVGLRKTMRGGVGFRLTGFGSSAGYTIQYRFNLRVYYPVQIQSQGILSSTGLISGYTIQYRFKIKVKIQFQVQTQVDNIPYRFRLRVKLNWTSKN